MRAVHRSSLTALAVLSTALLVGACSGSSGQPSMYSAGSSAPYGNAHNSNYVPAQGPSEPTATWSRPVGGVIAQSVTTGPDHEVLLIARTDNGCNVFSFDDKAGRKNWCNKSDVGAAPTTPLLDRNSNSYLGTLGTMNSYNSYGQTRWSAPVDGTPIGSAFLPDGNLLVLSQLGQLSVFNPQNGQSVLSPMPLIPFTVAPPMDWGLDQCAAAKAVCPSANPPAVDSKTGHFYLTFWKPGAPAATVLAMAYGPTSTTGGKPVLRKLWSSDVFSGGAYSAPALSADGKSVYEVDISGKLWALDASSGRVHWSHQLTTPPARALSVSPDGLIIANPDTQGPLQAIADRGNHAEIAWTRSDLIAAGPATQTAGRIGYVLTRSGDDGLALTTFDTSNGRTRHQELLPSASGFGVGVALSQSGRVIAPTRIGELFAFK